MIVKGINYFEMRRALNDPNMIPFDADGNLMHHVTPYVYEIVEKYEFGDILYFVEFIRGKSAAYAVFVNGEGRKFPMFLSELEKVLLHGVLVGGSMSGTFCFKKRGQNYSIGMVKRGD